MSAAPARVRSTVLRTAKRALDEHTKNELRALHEANPARWTPATLAARYGSSRARVAAVLRLGALRTRVQDKHAERTKALAEVWRTVDGPLAKRHTPPMPVEDDKEIELALAEAEDATEEEIDTVGTTETAEWAKYAIAKAEYETTRKSTFAFIEVGKRTSDQSRAVWIRDGTTGLLRAPSRKERIRILDQRTIVSE